MCLLKEVLKYYGLKEIVGPEHNPEILAMFAEIGYDWVKDDETAWCSAALNYFCFKLGLERSKQLTARSWLSIGESIKVPEIGDIVIYWRNKVDSWEGHVGIYINEENGLIYTLGGNQSNMINITGYSKDRVLGYRRLKKVIYKSKKLPPIKINIVTLWKAYRLLKKLLKKRSHVYKKNY